MGTALFDMQMHTIVKPPAFEQKYKYSLILQKKKIIFEYHQYLITAHLSYFICLLLPSSPVRILPWYVSRTFCSLVDIAHSFFSGITRQGVGYSVGCYSTLSCEYVWYK